MTTINGIKGLLEDSDVTLRGKKKQLRKIIEGLESENRMLKDKVEGLLKARDDRNTSLHKSLERMLAEVADVLKADGWKIEPPWYEKYGKKWEPKPDSFYRHKGAEEAPNLPDFGRLGERLGPTIPPSPTAP